MLRERKIYKKGVDIMKDSIKFLKWAVVSKCSAKNNGVIEEWEQINALFTNPVIAQDYIDNVLPKENRDRFRIAHIDDL